MKLNASRLGRCVKEVCFLGFCSVLWTNGAWCLQSLLSSSPSLGGIQFRKIHWDKALMSLLGSWWHCSVAQCSLLLFGCWVSVFVTVFHQHQNGFHDLIVSVFVFHGTAVISPPPVARSVAYSASPSSLEQANSGNMSPACKVSSALDPNLGNGEGALPFDFCWYYQ